METGADFFLEVLCLAIYCNDIETEKIIANALLTYYEEVKNGSSLNDETSKFYVKLITEIIQKNIDLNNTADVSSFLLKFEQHPAIKNNPKVIQRIEKIINDRTSIPTSRITHLKNKIKKWIVWVNGNNNLKQLFRTSQKVINTSDLIIQESLMNELLDRARSLTKTYEGNESINDEPLSIDFIDMTCKDSLRKGLELFKKKRVKAGYTSGLQGINRMFGDSNGPVPGEFHGYAALSHHYKSGILMDWARWIAIYNKPRELNGKQAAIVFISLENEIYENMMMWFKSAYKNHYGVSPDNMEDDDILSKISELYAARGFKLLVYRRDGDDFGYEEWKALHEELSEKYTIVSSILDYIGLMKLPETTENAAKSRQELASKLKNYCNRNSILGFTGLQLDTEAARIANSGVINVVKKFGSSHLADSKGVVRELDGLFYAFLEKNHLGDTYLTLNWAKHKYVVGTPEKDKYCAYKFYDNVGIPDDINGKDMSVRDIYNVTADNEKNTTSLF